MVDGRWLQLVERRRTARLGLEFRGADIFLGDPWIMSGSLDYGEQGHEDFFHGRVTLGAQWHAVEAFVGFEFLNRGEIEIGSTILGVRIWF